MLILTRRIGETLVIGDDVKVTILDVQGNQVRIGVDAPQEVAVYREEIHRRIQNEKRQTHGQRAVHNIRAADQNTTPLTHTISRPHLTHYSTTES